MPQGNLPEKRGSAKKQFRILDTSCLEYFCLVGFLQAGAHDPAVAVMKTKVCFKRRATSVLSQAGSTVVRLQHDTSTTRRVQFSRIERLLPKTKHRNKECIYNL